MMMIQGSNNYGVVQTCKQQQALLLQKIENNSASVLEKKKWRRKIVCVDGNQEEANNVQATLVFTT